MPFTLIPAEGAQARTASAQVLESVEEIDGTEALDYFVSLQSEDGIAYFLSMNPRCAVSLGDMGVGARTAGAQVQESVEEINGTEALDYFISLQSEDGSALGGVAGCPIVPKTQGNAWDFFHIPI